MVCSSLGTSGSSEPYKTYQIDNSSGLDATSSANIMLHNSELYYQAVYYDSAEGARHYYVGNARSCHRSNVESCRVVPFSYFLLRFKDRNARNGVRDYVMGRVYPGRTSSKLSGPTKTPLATTNTWVGSTGLLTREMTPGLCASRTLTRKVDPVRVRRRLRLRRCLRILWRCRQPRSFRVLVVAGSRRGRTA